MKTVTVTVSAPAGTGKTTVSTIIQEALENYGYPVEVDNPDGDHGTPRVLENVKVQLNVRQSPRSRGD